ncbi:MAG: aminodeoxychorismate synthase component I [Planctomycetota bacterium]
MTVAEIAGDASPFAVLCAIAGERLPFFLDSGMDPERLGRFSFVGCDPFLVVHSSGKNVWIDGKRAGRNPFAVLRRLLKMQRIKPPSAPIPFIGGAVGYFAYDLGRFIERLPDNTVADIPMPEMHVALYDTVAGFDHQTRKWHVSNIDAGAPGAARRRKRLISAINGAPPPPQFRPVSAGKLTSNFTHDEYLRVIRRTKDYIAAGDIFQANISQRFEAETDATPLELYAALRSVNPAPFAAYLPVERGAVLSSSPERFLKVAGRRVQTRPIKGTRPRREGDDAFNEKMRAELLASIKDRAELTMIVDLERNDLGRVCSYGSVQVTEPIVLEEYPTVYHLVATVEGDLHKRFDIVDLIKATFPGGSITGAPKIRAMEIIDELEPTKRSVYTGKIGYIGFDGTADLNIAIRTMLLAEGRVYLQVGGGIVADSDPELEYQETLDKARAMFDALGVNCAV